MVLAAAGGVHCIGMCGGISAAFSFSVPEAQRQGRSLWLWQGLFGLGRVTTYVLLGALAGALGAGLLGALPAPNRSIAMALSGVLMLLVSLYLLGKGGGLQRLEAVGVGLWRRLQPYTRQLMPVDRPWKALSLGMLWGFLPCGLIYTALVLATTAAHPLSGAAVMLVFGLITVVPVAATGVLGSQLQRFRRGPWPRIAALLTLIMAVWFFAMAAGIGGGHDHQHQPHSEHHQTDASCH